MLSSVLIRFKRQIFPMLNSCGFGLMYMGTRDALIEQDPMLAIPAVVGTFLWALSEYCDKSRPCLPCDSTKLVTQSLRKTADIGIMTGLINFIRQHDTNSANFGSIGMGLLFLPGAINEIEKSEQTEVLPLHWEKLRFLVLVGADYMLATGSKDLINGDYSNLGKSISLLAIGLLLNLGDMYLIKKLDVEQSGLDFSSAINRRGFKLCATVNVLLTVIDLATGNKDIYTLVDDGYAIAVSMLMVATILKLRELAMKNKPTVILKDPQAPFLEVVTQSMNGYMSLKDDEEEPNRALSLKS